MYNPRAENTSLTFTRQLRRLAGMRASDTGKYGSGRKKKAAVESQQRSWRMKRQSKKALFLLLLPAMAACLGWLAYTMLLHSDIFRMTGVTVQGNQVTTQQQILDKAGLRRGINLLTLDVSRAEGLIRQEQWVEQVWVKRHWPSRVEVIVQEYMPFALVNLEREGNSELHYVNRNGVVFAPSTAERDLDYPVVNGAELAAEIQDKRFPDGSMGAMALEFLRLSARGNQILPTQAVSEINVDPEKGLIVYLVDHPFPIYMGEEKVQLRFNRLVRVLAKLYREEKIEGVTEIRMDYGENKILVARNDGAS